MFKQVTVMLIFCYINTLLKQDYKKLNLHTVGEVCRKICLKQLVPHSQEMALNLQDPIEHCMYIYQAIKL